MNFRLKKTLFLSLAVLGMVATIGSSTLSVSAKSAVASTKVTNKKTVQPVDKVSDNAVRINLVDVNGHTVKSVDYLKVTASKGATLGVESGNTWTLTDADKTAIQSQITNALDGTSYTLSKLSTYQINELAQTKFGSSVNLTVNAKGVDSTDTNNDSDSTASNAQDTTTDQSGVTRYAVVSNQRDPYELKAVKTNVVDATVNFNDVGGSFLGLFPQSQTLTAQNIYTMQQQKSTSFTNLLSAMEGQLGGLIKRNNTSEINLQFQQAAEQQYLNSSDKNDKLVSPIYPQFEKSIDGGYTVNWYHVNFTKAPSAEYTNNTNSANQYYRTVTGQTSKS